jgi:hypothetical protein
MFCYVHWGKSTKKRQQQHDENKIVEMRTTATKRSLGNTPFDLAASWAIYSPPGREPRRNTLVIRRRGAEKRRTPSRRGEGRDG